MNDHRQAQDQIETDDQLEQEWRAKIQRALRDLRSMSTAAADRKAS